jgi:phosphoenolpyruvate synthase/pyruvate phosphate dikinase
LLILPHTIGEGIVSGEITPHSFVVDVFTGELKANNTTSQQKKVASGSAGGIETVDTSEDERGRPPVTPEACQALARAGKVSGWGMLMMGVCGSM